MAPGFWLTPWPVFAKEKEKKERRLQILVNIGRAFDLTGLREEVEQML